jgi:hypothetical protein
MGDDNENTDNKSGNLFTKIFGFIIVELKHENILRRLIVIVILTFLLMIILNEILKFIKLKYDRDTTSPWIIKGTKDAKKQLILEQDPNKKKSLTLYRSKNEIGGVEFTYMLWYYVDDWSYNHGKFKHMFHKGSYSGKYLMSPGVFLDKIDNNLIVVMNTYNTNSSQAPADSRGIYEVTKIKGIPINKWVHLVICTNQTSMDIYINGHLKLSHQFKNIPRQNYGNLYINGPYNLYGWDKTEKSPSPGFSGFLSNFRYFNYYISQTEIYNHLKKGPSPELGSDSLRMDDKPPYLSNKFW